MVFIYIFSYHYTLTLKKLVDILCVTDYTHMRKGDFLANIKDVAKKAGVSVATVSRYLNQKGYISTDAKNVIEIAIKELGYKPNLLARSLSTKQTNLLGLIVSDITNPFFPELARAVEDVALSYGYTVILCNSDEDAIKEIQYIDTLQQKLVAGFIITTNQHNKNYYETLNVPIVALDRAFHSSFPTVSTNNVRGCFNRNEAFN